MQIYPRRRRSRGRGSLFSLGAVLITLSVLLVLAIGAVFAADWMSAPAAPDRAALIGKAMGYDARIRRDEWGVPHVLGRTDADAAFGLAYAHAEDDFATIQDAALAVRGTLAQRDGAKAAVTDYLVRLLRVWETVNARYDRDLPPDLKRCLEAYADGVNLYGALHPEKVSPGLLPLTGKDIAAGFVFKTPFFYGLDKTLQKLTEPETKKGAARKPALPTGSNGVAVAPSRSEDGATRLLVNSHQPYTGPVAWYEAVVESGEGLHVAGGLFPGTPFMLHGHNAHLGWANTVNAPRLADVFKLTVNPKHPELYRLDGQWRPFEKSVAGIKVRLFGPLSWTVRKDVLWSVHGPVLQTEKGFFAVRYAGMGEVRQSLQYYRLDKAVDMASWKAAMGLQALPSINYLYADEKGNIGYVYNAQFPDRRQDVRWTATMPGERSDLIWQGYLPFERTPQIWNPASGYVFNSNNTPYRATGAADSLNAGQFVASMGIQTNMTNRALRAEETFGTDPRISAETFRKYKFDIAYSARSDLAVILSQIARLDPGKDPDIAAAKTLLAGWDRRADIHSRAAALAILVGEPIVRARDKGETPPDLRDALASAVRRLKASFGRIDPEWGEVNRIMRGAVNLPIDGGPDTFRAVYGTPQKDGRLKAVAGDTFIMFVSWDKDGKLSSESIHQFGSATLDARSSHYADQTPLFAAMKTKPVLFTEDQLRGHIKADYRPGQEPGVRHP